MHDGEFAYHRPRTVSEACALMEKLGEGAVFLGGGTEILPDFRRGRETARHLVSLRAVAGLDEIRDEEGALSIGGMVRLEDVARSPMVRRVLPALAEAASSVGGLQIRHQATIGGNFCRAVPCADTPPPCIVGEARVRLVSGDRERTLAAEDFFVGPRETVLQRGEILQAVLLPAQPARSGVSYQRFALRRGSALAVASVAARVVLDGDRIREARIALGAVAPVPLPAVEAAKVLEGEPATEESFAGAAARAAAEARPISDIRGSEAFRRELVKTLTHRALVEAAARARS